MAAAPALLSPTGTSVVGMSPWASPSCLPDDLVRLLASRLLAHDLLDYVRFRAVCAHWRSGTTSPRGRGVVDPRFHPRRWMMLPEGDGLYPGHPKLLGYVRFFNLDTGVFVCVHISLFENHCVLDSFDGLLVLQRDDDTAVRLLHPFTSDILDLSPLSTLLPQIHQDLHGLPAQNKKLQSLRSFSTAATFADDGVVTVMLTLSKMYRVAAATQGDRQWTISTWRYNYARPPYSYQGKTYVVYMTADDRTLKIFQIDTPTAGQVPQPPKLIATCTVDKLCRPVRFVEYDSEILVIGYTDIFGSRMLVYKLSDIVAEQYDVPLTSIGDKAIFVYGRALCVSAKALPTIAGDTIVQIHPTERYLAQYHICSGSWSPATDQCSLQGIDPGPCSLILHIFTCCSCEHWNKGLLFRYPIGGLLRWSVEWKQLRHGA